MSKQCCSELVECDVDVPIVIIEATVLKSERSTLVLPIVSSFAFSVTFFLFFIFLDFIAPANPYNPTFAFPSFPTDQSAVRVQKPEILVFDSRGWFQMASFTVPCPKCVPLAHLGLNSQTPQRNSPMVSYGTGLGLKKSLSFGSLNAPNGIQCLNRKQFSVWKSQAKTNEAVTVENSAPVRVDGPKVAAPEEKIDLNGKPSGPSISADSSSISAFMNQVSDLVKLVDSRDIMELQLKQANCELVIRKKEALQPPAATVMTQPYPYPAHSMPAASPPPLAPASPPPAKALPAPGKASTSSHPPLKCPMAGTFYRSPAPGEPPFVKVGDKVQKGQVVCIIEAMKLMNEIEADQAGTVTEVVAEDGKPVSLDAPLFVIVP
ncbi:hypothetical protein Fmac_017476 [Flemingia macrophylla]|uniref:Lipoyl-binding domain-containing protein n=1 Tax=Flemingia macrophylla TaxID=520843 RepID=A0ABD1M269_9FABA